MATGRSCTIAKVTHFSISVTADKQLSDMQRGVKNLSVFSPVSGAEIYSSQIIDRYSRSFSRIRLVTGTHCKSLSYLGLEKVVKLALYPETCGCVPFIKLQTFYPVKPNSLSFTYSLLSLIVKYKISKYGNTG